MEDLASRSCVPLSGEGPSLEGAALEKLKAELGANWAIVDQHHLRKQFAFPNFVTALAFVNRVGEVAETEGHHPNISFTWGKVEVQIWTHDAGGLTESDFILAAKIETLER